MAKVVKFRSAYSGQERLPFETEGESMTQQAPKHEADIRNIIKKYDRTGLIANVNRGAAKYGDFSEVNEYRESLDIVREANESFMQIPSDIREKFNNDAGEFFEFVTNPDNADEMVELGLREPEPEIEVQEPPAEPPSTPEE